MRILANTVYKRGGQTTLVDLSGGGSEVMMGWRSGGDGKCMR